MYESRRNPGKRPSLRHMHVLAATTIAPWNGWSLFLLMVLAAIVVSIAGIVGNRRERDGR